MRSSKKRIAIFGLKGLPGFGGAARANEIIISKIRNKYDFMDSWAFASYIEFTNNNGL